MGQPFLCKSFLSKINKTRRKNEEINNTPSTSMDYDKHFGSQDSRVILVDLKDYLYALENLLRIIPD
jgi:hypothetical protein